jgi:hypothetical protein
VAYQSKIGWKIEEKYITSHIMFKSLNSNPHRLLLISVILSFVPIALYIGASAFGWIGWPFGYTIEVFFILSWPVLIVYLVLALIADLIADRSPAKIKAVYLLLLALCVAGAFWSFYAHPFLNAFEHKLKRVYNNVPELQGWAIGMLNSHPNQAFTLDEGYYPAWIKNKSFPKPFIRVYNGSDTKYEYVELVWSFGSLLGQFGISVGRPELPKQGRKWADGVYFVVEPEPREWSY